MNSREAGARRAWSLADAALVALVLAVAGIAAHAVLRPPHHPEEDAAMLLRYAQHLAHGDGIVWNVGERPVDGATDFLFLVAVAAVSRLGAGVQASAEAVGLVAHLLTAVVVYLAVRRLHGGPRWAAAVSAAYLAVGPGLRYVAAGFGTTLFALAVAVAWWATVALVEASDRELRAALVFGAACLFMGLARPEGVFLSVFFLASALLARRGRSGSSIIVGFSVTFGLLGLAYFLWRWHYFGHPLPNPFYRRGGGMLHEEVLLHAVRNVWRLGSVFLAVIAAGLIPSRTRRWALAAALPIVSFTVLWVIFSDEANYYMRYRYPVLPVVLIGWVPVAQELLAAARERLRSPARVPAAVAAVLLTAAATASAVRHWRMSPMVPRRIGLYDVACHLSALRSHGYALATTEAGLLPLYSEWRSIDTWGLNDAWIAQHGTVTPEYLDRYRPDLIMFHAYFTPEDRNRASGHGLGPAWLRMTETLETYAHERGYVLAAVYERGREAHYYYVRRGMLDAEELMAAVRLSDYEWDGQPAVDATPGSTG